MPDSVVIPGRFNGPLESGNGGYSAGAVAAFLEGPVEVSLRSPVPLERPLEPRREDGTVRLLDGENLVAEARRVPDFELEVPHRVGVGEARAAMSRYRGLADGPFSRCFVCGRAREDAFGVFAGPLEERPLVASTWTPGRSTAEPGGSVRPEFVWAVLDCPTYFAAYRDEESTISFLAQLTVAIDAPVPVGEEHVVIAWPLGVEGRKRSAGGAVLSPSGEVLARGRALMIEPRTTQ
jgi:hypothetical protein